MARYRFDEVAAALREHWGLTLHRGGAAGDEARDGRWSVVLSRTGFIVDGSLPGRGHGGVRYDTLAQVVTSCGLAGIIERSRARSATAGDMARLAGGSLDSGRRRAQGAPHHGRSRERR